MCVCIERERRVVLRCVEKRGDVCVCSCISEARCSSKSKEEEISAFFFFERSWLISPKMEKMGISSSLYCRNLIRL